MGCKPSSGCKPGIKPRTGRLVITAVAAVIAVFLSTGFIWNRKEITIMADGRSLIRVTTAATVGEALKEAEVELNPGDVVTPPPSGRVRKGMVVKITRAIPVTLVAGGQEFKIRTAGQTVADALSDAGILLGPKDRVSHDLKAPLAPGMTIKVVRVVEKTVTRRVIIPYRTEKRPDPHLDKGRSRVLSKGADGLREEVVSIVYENGRQVSEEVISRKVIVPAVNEVIAVGTRNPLRTLQTSRGTYRYRDSYTMIATAFEAGPRSCGKYADGYTAIGVKAQRGVVAVDPNVIPLKTRLYVEGYGPALAADVGAAIKGYRIDVFLPTVEECLRFGRRRVKVYVLEDE
ncbi:MAG TPA: DUF348 domain-containing protein [Firmicutes bacterium]|nr:DUF348 domain-containing protein [Bacillota bacterium]